MRWKKPCAPCSLPRASARASWCVFGCGGDRDNSKRPLMGQAAQAHADGVFVTSDNPRSEVPESIIDQILAGMQAGEALHVQADRAAAIAQAIARAEARDVVLIAGKDMRTIRRRRACAIRSPTWLRRTRRSQPRRKDSVMMTLAKSAGADPDAYPPSRLVGNGGWADTRAHRYAHVAERGLVRGPEGRAF
jgi:hypothetical protein